MKNNRSQSRWWKILLSVFLLGACSSILFGGAKGLFDYRKSVYPGLAVNIEMLHFFTQDFLKRKYNALTVAELGENNQLVSFRLFSDESKLASLDSNLPSSGKAQFVSGHIQIDQIVSQQPSQFESAMQFRYRGGLPLHWLYKKKSFRIKLPPFVTYNGQRQFNLVNPSTIHSVTDWVSYDMSRSLGLLTPDYFPARVYVNNITNGLHYYLDKVDESFLRKNKRMPGSIYSGDTFFIANKFGKDKGIGVQVFEDDEGVVLLWKDERLWKKDSSRNSEQSGNRVDIKKYIEVINDDAPLSFMQSFNNYFDKEKFYLFMGLDTLTGSYHHDNFHNHKIYFDPYKGKFEPIQWDMRYWSGLFPGKDLPLYPLLKKVKLNPILEFERDKVTYELMALFPVEKALQMIDERVSIIEKELASDPYRHFPDQRYGGFSPDKEVPFSMEEFDASIDELKSFYRLRQADLQNIFERVDAKFTTETVNNNSLLLTVSVGGNSPITVNPERFFDNLNESNSQIFMTFEGSETQVSPGQSLVLYPGRSLVPGNILERTDKWSIYAFGNEKVLPSYMHYKFIIKGPMAEKFDLQKALDSVNSITGNRVSIERANELPSDQSTSSIHPWKIQSELDTVEETIEFSGEVEVEHDIIFDKHQHVIILPGTRFKIAKSSSLVFYGKVTAIGTQLEPIEFIRKDPNDAWGSIVIQGESASGTEIAHIKVIGGSITSQRLIDYPGQLNIHDLSYFKLSNCEISANTIGDDSLHVSYAVGEVSKCQFSNTAFDAIDIDIAKVKVTDITFSNIGNDALDLMTSEIIVSNVNIKGAGDKCFSIGEGSTVDIRNSELDDCEIGVAVKDDSKAYIEDLFFTNIRQRPIALYRKNLRYSQGGTVSGKRLFGISIEDIELDDSSVNNIPSHELKPSESYLP